MGGWFVWGGGGCVCGLCRSILFSLAHWNLKLLGRVGWVSDMWNVRWESGTSYVQTPTRRDSTS